MKGAWRAIREGRLCTNDTREREEKKKQEARSLAQLIINAKMMFLIMNRPPKRWCFLIPSGGKEGEKKGLIYALDGPSFFFSFFFKPKTCYSNRGQMLIDDLLRTRKRRRIFEKEDTKVYCSCVVFGQIPWRRNHLSTPSKYGRGHVGIYLYRAAVAFRGSEKKALTNNSIRLYLLPEDTR